MERVSLSGRRRDRAGKSAARRLRRSGLVPAVVYGRGREPVALAVDAKALRSTLHTHAGLNVLIDLAIDGADGGATVMVKEVQRDILRRDVIHVDFHAIDLTERLEAHVPLEFVGQPKGVVADGGVFEVHLREIVVECLPTQIPEAIQVDVSGLTIGHSLHASDLRLPPEVTLVTPPGEAVATVVMPRVVEEAAAAAPAEAAAPAAPAEVPPAPEARPAEEKKD